LYADVVCTTIDVWQTLYRVLSGILADRVSSNDQKTESILDTPSRDPISSLDTGLQYLSRESYSSLMEVWKARTPDGRLRQVKILKGLSQQRSLTDQEMEKIAFLKHLKHPRLAPIEDVQFDEGRVLIIGNLPEMTLFDRWKLLLTQGKPGIDRKELLQYLAIITESLEYLSRHAQLYHLFLNPHSLYYFSGRLRVADYSLPQLAWLPAGQTLNQIGLRYAAPELYENAYHQNSDQYSLALIYAEMLTGQLPVHGNTLNQWREQRRAMKFDLKLLPAHEHEVIYKALEYEPSRRYASSSSFLENLIQSIQSSSGYRMKALDTKTATDPSLLLTGEAVPMIPQEEVDVILRRLIQVIAMKTIYNKDQGIRFLVDETGKVIHRCAAWLPGGLASKKLEGFAHEWDAKLVHVNNQTHEYIYKIRMSQNIWQKLVRRKAEFIEIRIQLTPPKEINVKQTEVEIQLGYTDAKPENERDRLEIVVPALLCSLRTYLLAKSEARVAERYKYETKVYLYPIHVSNVGEPIMGQTQDISYSGMRIFTNNEFTAVECIIQIHTAEFGSLIIPARVQRCEPLSTGMYDIGVKF
jgi:serine/threonine protein kinase